MDAVHVLIIDLDPDSCPEGHCGRLAGLLGSVPSTKAISVRILTRFPPDTISPPPHLVFLRSSAIKSLSEIVQFLRRMGHAVPILGLFCTGKDTPSTVLRSLYVGLDDFLTCPIKAIDLYPRVQRLLQGTQAMLSTPQVEEMQSPLRIEGLVGESGPFLQVIHRVLAIAHADATVLLTGETGTGKELIARAIHYHGPRQSRPFVPVNCGALPDHLVENELFGHTKGAYTDASTSEKGLVVEAKEGTLFLDEVDALSTSAQVKLLRFLQDREYRPLGSSRNSIANVRVIAATNADLWQLVQVKQFREDLYYRLHILSLHLPPLRERLDDIPLLAAHFMCRHGNLNGRKLLPISADALHKLMAYPWPGNIRELETVIQRALILASSPTLQPEDFELSFSYQNTVPDDDSFRVAKARVIAQFERAYLSDLLAAHYGNITHAAEHAGEARRSLQRLLKKHGLHRSAFRS